MPRQKTRKNFLKIIFACLFVIIIYIFVSAHFFSPKQIHNPDKKLRKIYTQKKIIQNAYRIPIITYHYVENVKDQGDTIRKSLNIPPYIFEKELQVLNENNFKTFFVKEIPKIISGEIPYSSRSAVLTFDDGYEDFYLDAFPLLKKYQIKATIYIVNNFIGLKGFMNEKEIKEIIDSKLVEVGAHTLDHYYLKKAPLMMASSQIIESKKQLEEEFNIKVDSFAYPYGAFDQNSLDLVKLAGFKAAVSVIPGIKQTDNNMLLLYRIRAGSFSYNNLVYFFDNYKKNN